MGPPPAPRPPPPLGGYLAENNQRGSPQERIALDAAYKAQAGISLKLSQLEASLQFKSSNQNEIKSPTRWSSWVLIPSRWDSIWEWMWTWIGVEATRMAE